jgi:hypothetical protein
MLGKDWVVCQMLQKLLFHADTKLIQSVVHWSIQATRDNTDKKISSDRLSP